MTNAFTTMFWGATDILATSGDWTRSVGDIALGVIETEQFVEPSPWLGGDQELGAPRAFGRRFSFFVDSVFDGTAASVSGAHHDEMQFLGVLFNPGSLATTELKTTRLDTSGATVARSIWVRCTAARPVAYIDDKGDSGIWFVSTRTWGRIRYQVDCYAPWPYWRDTTENSQAFTTATAVTNSGPIPCGCKIILTSKSGTVNPLVASNNTNSYTTSWTSPADNAYADWGHTDPSGASVLGTVSGTSFFRLESGSNALTKTITGGGSMTATVYWRANHFTP